MTPELKATSDYSIFDRHPLNRDCHNSVDLEESMKKYGFRPSSPIHVVPGTNGKLLVKRGQNRLETAKKLGIPVYYVIDDDPMSLHEWERDRKQQWSLGDFTKSNANNGSQDCKVLMEFKNKHRFSILTAATLIGAKGSQSKKIRNGKFVVASMDHGEKVAGVTDEIKKLGFEFATTPNFVMAISNFAKLDQFNCELFVRKAKTHIAMLEKFPRVGSKQDYARAIENLYHYCTPKGNRIPLAFYADQKASLES
jgi:hypothetical protein